ncbi:kinesin-domain-containing protein [Metschnikowia bicuspidata var. bicuspidata NRRL YB-4993]|uniref:Kinesin-like protein n=1 Tax=Metschnikowia bicuspidata var. bicuspidata NRRL YB-4993 TaxID=869754 RepID=A0A1A0HDH9_9ASCO|nr:kinesin-domain-containing protein [Metschnikowia bicuspidata var. bicuspidata NRRL YB-4993]OBA22139.1 kinesin-domain-containing protein [Metschnikowia bicuspidata var. bicuspidata NRRL YB-4993]
MPLSAARPASRQSSIGVAVRVRPFTAEEARRLEAEPRTPVFSGAGGLLDTAANPAAGPGRPVPGALRKIVSVVDDRMLVFDPPEQSALASMQRRAFPNAAVRGRLRDCRFVFDQLFDESASQHDVYTRTTRPLLDSVLDGYNATVFAYGATGCGKTHTILGTADAPGVVFLTMAELYRKIGLLADTRHVDVQVSFLEIYNETIRDLLAPATPAKALVLREDLAQRIVVANLLTHRPACVADVMRLLAEGNRNRTLSPTEANAASSRSHAVLQIHVALRARTAALSEEHTHATLSVIDLAGSERAAATKNRGPRLNEGANINKSLLALGNCINALCDPGRRNHVPYRDLKLTRLLKFSLGGNCKTVMIVCVSPLSQHYDETWNTLKYADRAKQIKTKLVRNRHSLDRHVGSYLKMITEQKLEIDELRAREDAVVQAAAERLAAQNAACLDALMAAVASLRATVDRPHHDKWRRYFLLAKRKFLLLHLQELHQVLAHAQHGGPGTRSHAVRRFVVQAEQLHNKLSEQVVRLERFYDARQQVDDILEASVAHALARCQEMDGWGAAHTRVFQDAVDLLRQRLQRDVLINSSVLFDYLVGQMGDFSYLSQVLGHTIDSSQRYRAGGGDARAEAAVDDALDKATAVLQRMNGLDYDLALEAAASRFIDAREDAGLPTPAAAGSPPFMVLPGGSVLPKRLSTSPLRNSPATKRSLRLRRANFALESGRSDSSSGGVLAEDSDISMDNSALLPKSDLEEDSPISNRVNSSMLDFDAMDCASVLDSPPAKRADREARGRPAGSPQGALAEYKLALPANPGPTPKHLLLNKQASTKVASEACPDANPAGPDLCPDANSSMVGSD